MKCRICKSKQIVEVVNLGKQPLANKYPKNIREWQRKGGIGILHTSASSTISQLRKLGY